jgi:hypothetical protein
MMHPPHHRPARTFLEKIHKHSKHVIVHFNPWKERFMVTMTVGQFFVLNVLASADGTTPDPQGETGAPTLAVDTAGVVTFSVGPQKADGSYDITITAAGPGSCNVTPDGTNTAAATFQGAPVAVTVNPAPIVPATTFIETVGSVQG